MLERGARVDRWLRSAAFDLLTRRDGLSGWRAARGAFRRLSEASPAEQRRHVARRVSDILAHALATVPHYRQIADVATLDVATGEVPDGLPLLTKDVVRTGLESLVSEAVGKDHLEKDFTSGTTHSRTAFYRDHACAVARVGRQWGILERCGYRPGDRRGLIWGVRKELLDAGPRPGLRTRFRRFATASESLACAVMDRQDLLDYHRRLRAFQPGVLYGYPSAMAQFATFVQEEGLAPVRVRRVFCTAERLSEVQRNLLTEAFGGEVFNLYCTREHGCIGFECSWHRGFHVDVGGVLIEILHDGRPAPPGQVGDIVVTDLLNYGMPMIRYVIGDRGAMAGEPCECGCALPLLSALEGRAADLLYRPDGSVVVGHLLSYLFGDLPSVRRVQFVQEDVSSLDVNIVPGPGAQADLRDATRERVGGVMGPHVTIRVNVLNDIPRHPESGKFQEVICRVARPVVQADAHTIS